MAKEDLIRMFPTKRISAFDGMAVTAQVWANAHEYHRQRQQLHALFSHGSGIVTGLEVVASDPPDSTVYILPGIAMDPLGRIIVLSEPVAYDVAQSHGFLRLLLTYGESQPRAEDDQETSPRFIHTEFGVYARPEMPESACVELARVRRQARDSAILNAQDAEHPRMNEIDQRFRQQIGATPHEVAHIAVSYAGGERAAGSASGHGRGASRLARTLRHSGPHYAWVDPDVPLGSGLGDYTLVYLVGQGAFQLSQDEMQALYTYLQGGGTVLIESCRRNQSSGDPPADAAFSDLLASLGIRLDVLQPGRPGTPGHSLLTEPYLFAAPPAGYEANGTPQMSIGGIPGATSVAGEADISSSGVIFSTFDYGCLWQGERRGKAASREEIRAALEWGCNIVAYALSRQRETEE